MLLISGNHTITFTFCGLRQEEETQTDPNQLFLVLVLVFWVIKTFKSAITLIYEISKNSRNVSDINLDQLTPYPDTKFFN